MAKKVWKRKIAFILALLTFFTAVNLPLDVSASDTVFSEDFDSGSLSAWQSQTVGSVEDGRYTILYDGANTVRELGTMTNCAVSADVSVSTAQAANGFTVGGAAYVAARASSDMTQGYEFGIGVSQSGSAYVRLYRRGVNNNQVLYQKADSIEGVGEIRQNTTYNLKLITAENRILCYVNDVLVIDMTDDTYTSGAVGVHNVSAKGVFDNFKVEQVPERKIERLNVISHSDSISRVGKLFFTVEVVYNSVYGSQILDQDSPGITYSGLDGQTGTKNIVVSYENVTTTFPLEVTEEYKGSGLYSDDFSGDLSAYKGGVQQNKEYGYEYKFVTENGMAKATVPNMNGADNPLKIIASLPAEKTEAFEAYTVVADAYIYSDLPTATKRLGAASIVYARNNESGLVYDMRVQSDGTILFYCGSELLYSTTAQAEGLDISFGKKIAMRAHVHSDFVDFYCDGKKVYTYLGYSREECTPYVGFSAINGTVAFDRFAGATLEVKGDYAISSMEVITTANNTVKTITASSLDFGSLTLKLRYLDNSVGYKRIEEDMISGYDANKKGDQTITITYAGRQATFDFHYVPYLFYDDFAFGMNAKWKFTSSPDMSYLVTGERLKFEYDSTASDSANIVASVQDGEEWTDYTVSSDVFLDPRGNANGLTRYAGVIARYDGSRCWYEFRLICTGGSISGALYRFNENGTTLLQNYYNSTLLKCMSGTKILGTGIMYNMRMDVHGNTITTYLDGVRISTYVDESGEALTSGTAGIRNINNTAYYDNFIVQKRNMTIQRLYLEGYEDKALELYLGFDIELWNHNLIILYADGETESVLLRADMISDYDNTVVGRQQVTLSYLGKSSPMYLEFKERPEHIKSVEAAILNYEHTDREDFYALKEQYDTLSAYEAAQLSEGAVSKYKELYEQVERETYIEIADSELLVDHDFNNSTESDWIQSIEGDAGKWNIQNSLFYEAQRPYGLSGTAWGTPDIYGELTSISTDFQMLSENMYLGVGINMGEDGYYHTRISNKTRDENLNAVYTLQLYRRSGEGHTLITSVLPEVNGVKIELGKWYNLRLTVNGNMLSVYIDDIPMLTTSESGKVFSVGECGMRISEGDALFDNVRVYGTKLQREDAGVVIEPTEYTDDFEDETEGDSPSHWQENYEADQVIDNWKVYRKDSLVYGTQGVRGYTATWLHVFDNNPQFTAKFMVESPGGQAQAGFITRRSPDTAYVNIGYDFAEKKWFIAAQESEVTGEEIFWAEETSELTLGEWHEIEVMENGALVSVLVDGEPVIEIDNVKRTGHGRVGAFTKDAEMYLDEVAYTFSSGDVPMDGITSYVVVPEEYAGFMEIESPDDGKTLVGVSELSQRISDNAGLTWRKDTEGVYDGFSKMGYSSILKLKNGKHLQVNGSGDDVRAELSEDLRTWEDAGRIVPLEDQVDEHGYRCVLIHVNTPTEYTLADGTDRIFCPIIFRRYNSSGSIIGHYTRVYYSDDGGYTWTASENSTKEVLFNYTDEGTTTWAESKVVQCSDGTLRLYYSRNYLGCMQYTVSEDNGVTWEGLYQIPEMQCPMTSFAVMEDPTEPGTYYMLWVNGRTNYLGSIHPRTRICLVKSTDGMNWEFVMNCEWMTSFISDLNGVELYQILDPSLYITEDYVYVTFGRSEREFSPEDANSHQAQRCYYIRAEKDKLTTRPWDASTISSMSYPKTIEFEEMPQTKFALNDLFYVSGTIKLTDFLGNTRTENISDNCTYYEEPNMYELGTKTVSLYYKNGTKLSYDIEVVLSHDITWNISEGGTVEPAAARILEGDTQEFKLVPEEGYQVERVLVNDTVYEAEGDVLTVSDVTEDITVAVTFGPKPALADAIGGLGSTLWIVLGAVAAGVLIAGGAVLYVLYRKKHAGKVPPERKDVGE